MSLRRILRRASRFLILGICVQFAGAASQGGLCAQTVAKAGDGNAASAQEQQKIAASAIKMPLFFEANAGQTDPSVRFLTRSNGYTMFLTPTETVLVEGKNGGASGSKFGKGLAVFRADAKNAKRSVLRMELLGANAAPEFQGLQELPGKVNYLIGKNEAAWHTNVALFSEVQVAKVYPGVDLLFHGDERQLEYDFVVAPGVDPSRIGFRIKGAKKIEIAANGDLILHTADSEFKMRKPAIYQGDGASRSEVQGRFVLSAKNQVRFELGPYDHAEKLVIDPAINYATFLGGAGAELSEQLVVDSSSPGAPKIYTTGITTDVTSFPLGGSRIGNPTGTQNLYVSEIDPTKTGSASLVYLTFIGGSTPFQSSGATTCETDGMWLVLDESHQDEAPVEPVIAGRTGCADYPGKFITPNVTGSGAEALAAVVTRLTSTGTSIDVSVLLGGNGAMSVPYVFVDATGDVLVSGGSASTNLPTMPGAYVMTFNNGATGAYDDCYTAKLQRSDLTATYFSYLNMGAGSTGPSSPAGAQAAVCGGVIDSNNPNILYFGGNTFSTVAFAGAPTSVLGFQPTFQGTEDAFVMKLDSSVSGLAALQYATYIGGGGITEVNTGAHQLGTGMAVLAGFSTSNSTTNAPDIPLGNSLPGGGANAAAGSTAGENGFVMVMDTTKSGKASLVSGSYFGGSSGVDEIRALGYDPLIPGGFYIIVGGLTQSTDFPTLHPFQPALSGTQDGFVAAFFITPTTAVTEFSSYIGAGPEDLVTGVDIDSNHAIYATSTTIAMNFFGNTSPATTVNGFQTTCTSCATPGAALPDATIFALTSAASATVSAQILANTTTLAKGSTEQLNVLATYSDGTFQDLTSKVTWSSSNPSAATISSSGLVSAVGAGMTTTISATLAGTTIPSITITVPAVTGLPFNVVLEGTAYGTVTDNLGQINCTNTAGQGTTGTCNTTYPSGTQVILTQVANPGSVFATWGTAIGDASCPGVTATCAFTMDEQEEITATFNNGAVNFTLSVFPAGTATGGGTVTGAGSISCTLNGANTPTGTCSATVASGSIETLSALPNQTSNFTSWSGPCTVPAGQPAKCVVTMSQNQQVMPLFTTQASSFTVALTGLGTVSSTSTPTVTPEIDCANPAPPSACSTNFTSGTQVTLTATPATGYSFTNWTAGPCAGATNPCVFTVSSTSRTSATALFTINTYLLTVNRAGTLGGTVTSNAVNAQSGSISCGPAAGVQGCAVNATFNTAVTLTETPPAGGAFGSWSGTPTACTVSGATCTFAMPAGPETVTATFNTTAPGTITITPTPLPFGLEAIGLTSTPETLTVSNTGNTTVTFTSIAMSGDFAGATLAQCPSIAVDAKPCTFQITFTPTAAGTRTGTITFTDNATGSPQTVALTGTGVAVAIGITPTALTFGSQAVGTTSAAQTVTVSNNGNFPLNFSSIVTSGDFAGATLAQCPSIGEENPPCVFSITFKPTATGTRTGAITFTDNGTGSPQTVTLTGTGAPGTATLTVTPSSLVFGSQALTTTSAPLSVTVMNTSTAAVNFTGFTTSGADAEDFGVPLPNTSGGCNPTGTLAAGAGCTISVVFTPQANGARTATLNIADNATGSPQMVALSGTGVTSQVIVAVAPGGSTTATTVSGGTAYYGLVISGAPGVTGTVQLGCIPSSVLITCKVIPGSVTLNGGTTEVAFAIQTFCQGTPPATGFVTPVVGGNGGGMGLLLVTMIFGGAMWTLRRKRRVAMTFATLMLVAMGSAACNSLPQGPNGATPAGTYNLSLTSSLNGGPPQTLNNFLTLVVK
jgi:hypothetical protein